MGNKKVLITDLLPAEDVNKLLFQEMKMTRDLNNEIKAVREYLFTNFGEFSEHKILSFENGEKHTVDLLKMVIEKLQSKI